jgi:hypothetical protein
MHNADKAFDASTIFPSEKSSKAAIRAWAAEGGYALSSDGPAVFASGLGLGMLRLALSANIGEDSSWGDSSPFVISPSPPFNDPVFFGWFDAMISLCNGRAFSSSSCPSPGLSPPNRVCCSSSGGSWSWRWPLPLLRRPLGFDIDTVSKKKFPFDW